MKATGIVRKIDDLGRIVIPREIRRTLQIREDDPMEIFVDGDSIIFRKYQPGCVFCGSLDHLVEINDVPVCGSCAKAAPALYENGVLA